MTSVVLTSQQTRDDDERPHRQCIASSQRGTVKRCRLDNVEPDDTQMKLDSLRNFEPVKFTELCMESCVLTAWLAENVNQAAEFSMDCSRFKSVPDIPARTILLVIMFIGDDYRSGWGLGPTTIFWSLTTANLN